MRRARLALFAAPVPALFAAPVSALSFAALVPALFAALALAACGPRESTPVASGVTPPAASPQVAPPPAVAPAGIEPRDQYAMLEEMLAAERVPVETQAESVAAVRSRWEGHRYRWEMMRVAGLCTRADSCLFAPFDLARFAHPIDAAFLPQVTFDAAGFSALRDQCAAHGGTCVVTFEATLTSFTFSIAEPTTLTLTNARVVSARNIRDGEYFLSRPPRVPSGPSTPQIRRALLPTAH